ncbi:MAG: DUF5666 domain-containing protein [Pirellulales bacterium]
MKVQVAVSFLLSVFCASVALAHEGKTHVMGTVSAVDMQRVVVADREGKTVTITLTKDTKYEQGHAPAAASALKVGTRVVIDVTGKPESLTATEIRVAPAESGQAGDDMHGGEQGHQHNE